MYRGLAADCAQSSLDDEQASFLGVVMRDIRIGVWSSGLAAIQMSQLSPRQSHPDTPCMQVIDPLCRQACGTPSKGNGHSAATMACELLKRWRALSYLNSTGHDGSGSRPEQLTPAHTDSRRSCRCLLARVAPVGQSVIALASLLIS